MPDADLSAYARHSRWTEPGTFAAYLAPLPADPAKLPELVGGLVLHPLFTAAGQASTEPQQRSVPEILGTILSKDDRPLDCARSPAARALGTCRNYDLLACAVLRQHRVPARLRVGFADYFTPDFWEDHWVCEYHDGAAWRLLDPELTQEVCHRFGVPFDPADVPRNRFLAAGPAWSALRHAKHDPARFGVSALGIAGLWFAGSSLLRDLAALNREEMMPWDFWGAAREFRPDREIAADGVARLDCLADALIRFEAGHGDTGSILAKHPWAALESSVLSFPQGKPIEIAIV